MKVLVACEESQVVCAAFRRRGHEAYSCDIQEPSGGHPEWHILGDAVAALRGGQILTMDGNVHDIGSWDLLIAHPPCTFLSNAGAARLYKKIGEKHYVELQRLNKGLDAKEFFLEFLNCDIPRIAVENPIPSSVYRLPKYTQICSWVSGGSKKADGTARTNCGMKFRDSKRKSKTFQGIGDAMSIQWGKIK